MSFNLNADGINIHLDIRNYKASGKDNGNSVWCRCDYKFSCGEWLNYHKEDVGILDSSEVERLESMLAKLVNGMVTGNEEISFTEPDFVFHISPAVEIQNTILDISAEWRIYFWDNGALTNNYLSITLDRKDIVELKEYLSSIISKHKI